MNNNLNIAKVVYPQKQLTQDEWVKEVNFGRMYVKPYQYFSGNVYQPINTSDSLFNKLIKLLNKIS